MNISTNDRMDLCEAVAEMVSDIAKRQGKVVPSGEVFDLIFGGDYCDIFDGVLGAIDEG